MKKYQIFVSSTYTDLKDERQAAVEAILKAGHIPAGMELFTASNQSQWTTIEKWIDESDIYMLILGGRYGSIEPKSGLSYTELEYDYALKKNKPLFAVIIENKALNKKVKKDGKTALRLENSQKMKAFNAKVKSCIVSFFEDSKDIKSVVYESVGKLQQENKLIGWVRADEVLNPQQYLDQITALQHEKEALNEENIKLKKIIENNPSSEDFNEIIAILNKETVSLKTLQAIDLKMPEQISLLGAFGRFKNSLIVGVANNMYCTDEDKFIFYDLSPQLEIHGLMHLEEFRLNSSVRRYIITEKGRNLLAYMAKQRLINH